MERFLGLEIENAKEREAFLRDNADKIEELGYTKAITADELNQLKDELVANNIELNGLKEEKKEAVARFNELIKPLKEANKELTAELKSRSRYVTEPCYKFVEGNEVGYYNSEGRLVFTRPARQDERQPRLFGREDFHSDNQYKRTGTTD